MLGRRMALTPRAALQKANKYAPTCSVFVPCYYELVSLQSQYLVLVLLTLPHPVPLIIA
jgi:hypothetical protein